MGPTERIKIEDRVGQPMLTDEEREMLDGGFGPAVRLAMRVIVAAARTQRAARLIPVAAAHIDSCLYHGQSSLDFCRALVDGGGHVRVPSTLNVGGTDLHRARLFVGSKAEHRGAREVMHAYVQLGCEPTFTCAPYQLPDRPGLGADVAWAESNAIAFGNSMIGLRTNRYGDLIDICAAITGRVPLSGLHIAANRAATRVFVLTAEARNAVEPDLLPALTGYLVGRWTGPAVPALTGLDAVLVDEDWGKAFGAAAASSGGVGMFHLVGVTPEAPDLWAATGGDAPTVMRAITAANLADALAQLTTARADQPLGGVSLGTPHLSRTELVRLADSLAGRQVRVPTYATTARHVLVSEPDAHRDLERSGVTVVTDTCTYMTPIMRPDGIVMTNSAKWAFYAPAQRGFQVLLASATDCVESAVSGKVRLHVPVG